MASVDDMKLTVTTRMYITMTWHDERVVYTATDKDDNDVYMVSFDSIFLILTILGNSHF